MGGPRSNLRPAGLNPVRHWTVFHMFLLRSARGFCLHLESELGGKRIDSGRPEAMGEFCWWRINLGQTGKTLKENSLMVNPFCLLRLKRKLRLVHPGLQKYSKEEGRLSEDLANARILGWSTGLAETMGKGWKWIFTTGCHAKWEAVFPKSLPWKEKVSWWEWEFPCVQERTACSCQWNC